MTAITELKLASISHLNKTDLENKVVLVRVDYNVPMDGLTITDDTRIRSSFPTIDHLIEADAKVVLVTHMGRPKGKVVDAFRLKPIYQYFRTHFSYDIQYVEDTIGSDVEDVISSMPKGSILLLENVRFYNQETENDLAFSQELAKLADIFVQDAFGAVHRAHASTAGVAQYLPTYMGLLVEKEVEFLSRAVSSPERPYTAIIGGAKVSTKIEVIKNLLTKVDHLVIGGAMAFTFLKAKGFAVGKSLYEEDFVALAKDLMDQAEKLGKELILPDDVVVTDSISKPTITKTVDVANIDHDLMGVDVGPKSLQVLKDIINTSNMIVWNGPLGVFEVDEFSTGTCECARYLASSNGVTIVGGGDSIAALEKVKLSANMTHISTGGGACLEFLEGKVLPGIDVIGR